MAARAALDPPFGALAPTPGQAALIRLARSTFLHRGTFRPFMARRLHALRPGPLDIVRDFGSFRLHYTDNVIEIGLLLHPTYNFEDIAFITEAMQDGGTFLDLGANIGLYSIAVALAAPACRVVAVEPGPTARGRLEVNIAASNLADRITVAPVAISDKARKGSLVFKYGDNAISRFEEGVEGPEGQMETVTLISLLDELGIDTIGAIKIDIEGREAEALGPFFREAPQERWPRRIVIEHLTESWWGADLFGQLRDCGYRELTRTQQNALLERA